MESNNLIQSNTLDLLEALNSVMEDMENGDYIPPDIAWDSINKYFVPVFSKNCKCNTCQKYGIITEETWQNQKLRNQPID